MASVRLLSLNIYLSKYFDRSINFITAQSPDVLCLQELLERDIPTIEKKSGLSLHTYAPLTREKLEDGTRLTEGVGIFSNLTSSGSDIKYYVGTANEIPETDVTDSSTYEIGNRALAIADVMKDGVEFRILTTHFTWSPKGLPTDRQRQDLRTMLQSLNQQGHCVICGDFNAPRGGEIFSEITKHYFDRIPTEYDWSIDTNLHRAGEQVRQNALAAGMRGFMVDGLFTTPEYTAENVELHTGVSDHCAITAQISRGLEKS